MQTLREEGVVSEAAITGKTQSDLGHYWAANTLGPDEKGYVLNIEFDRHAATRFRDFETGAVPTSKGGPQPYPYALEVEREVFNSVDEGDTILVVFASDIAGYDKEMFQTIEKVKARSGFSILALWYVAATACFFSCWLCVTPLRTRPQR